MSHSSQTRAVSRADHVVKIKPMTAAAAFGGLVGLAIGCAYLGGTTARATALRAQAEQIQGAASAGFTEEALAAAAGGLDASALSIARRHDPYTSVGAPQRDRQAELLSARLEQLRAPGDLRQASLGVPTPARPFQLGHALDASRDLDCLTQAVYYEARGEGRDGMKAVAQVVLNRVRHPAFPKTVCGVVFQGATRGSGCQFSFTCSGVMRGRVNPAAWDRARAVASGALSGSVFAAVGSATHFHTTHVSPGWRGSLVQVSQIGSHLFYRFGGRSGASSAFTYAARPSTSADQPRLIHAVDRAPADAAQPSQPVAYSAVAAPEKPTATTPAATPAPRQAAAATEAPAPAPVRTARSAAVAKVEAAANPV
ncbi:cell wall hydrolase [Brevundimonas sp. SORGH_AS_0993]|uniref:cell wall hydrolase n=1 Tax=Brevundimonas sp. SORGH_AS_0993 TaxID=3041794 RepID=UPI002784F1BF|nr:cell wall hydrolase [Brevundimonas sp. SORGH_AS_0993]MDQ1154255.1 spore germination cell wall hydrolase CwlJ-like protein [Brevundimonas sp. SORGH_AS_0993]